MTDLSRHQQRPEPLQPQVDVRGSRRNVGPNPSATTVTDTVDLLHRAELQGERLAAAFRLVVFASLLLVVAFTGQGPHQFDLTAWTALYGIGTVVGLVLAWRRVFRAWIPYLFVTFDIGVVAVQLLLLSRHIGMPSAHSFAMPIAGLVFVIMVHASMRYRPWLVVYAAALFILLVESGALFLPTSDEQTNHGMGMADQGMLGDVILFQVFPILVICLCALILFAIGRRTRGLLLDSIEQTMRTANLARYFSPNLAEQLAVHPNDQALKGGRRLVAILFVDIRGFTAMAEHMDPVDLGTFLSDFRNRLVEPIFAHEGTVDKFIGDAIMAVFGAPVTRSNEASRALSCGLEIIKVVNRWSIERQQAGLSPVGVGIGGHYGEVFAGALGDEQLLEYTVIGDTVNVAERLERLTRQVDSSFVISDVLFGKAQDVAKIANWQHLSKQTLSGHEQPIDAMALIQSPSQS